MACIRKRRGKWVIDYRDVSGKRRWETVEGNRSDAEGRLAKIVSNGKRVETKRLFKEYAEDWLNTYRVELKDSTYINYESVLRTHLYPAFGSVLFSKITRGEIKKLVAEKIKSGLSRNSVRNIISPLREMFNHAIEDGVVTSNPAARVGRFNKPESGKKINPFTTEELVTLLETAKEKMVDHYPFLLCAARTGIREGELIGLKCSDIDFRGRFIEVQRNIFRGQATTPKNDKRRRVDMSMQLTNGLDQLLSRRKADALRREMEKPREERREQSEILNEVMDGWLFTTPSGTQLNPSNLRQKVFNRLLDMAGLRRIRFHDLRHTFASLLIQHGESLVYVRDQLGHQSIQITVDVYGHLVPGGNKRAVDRLDDDAELAETDKEIQSGSRMVADMQVKHPSH